MIAALLAGWCGAAALAGLLFGAVAGLSELDEKSLEKVVQRWAEQVESSL